MWEPGNTSSFRLYLYIPSILNRFFFPFWKKKTTTGQLVLEVKQDPASLLLFPPPPLGPLLAHSLPPRCVSWLRPELLHRRSSLTFLLLICMRSPNYNLPKCFSIFYLSCSKSINEWVRRLVSKSHLFHFLSYIFSWLTQMDFCCQNFKKALPSLCISFHDQSFWIQDLSSWGDVSVSSTYWLISTYVLFQSPEDWG